MFALVSIQSYYKIDFIFTIILIIKLASKLESSDRRLY